MGVGEERVVIFDKDGIVQLKRGVIVCIEGDKFEIHSSDRKEVFYFDKEGKLIDKHPSTSDFGCLKYFFKMGKKERKTVKNWIKFQKTENEEEKSILRIIKAAVNELHCGYYIATIDASLNKQGLYYKKGDKACNCLSEEEWAIKAKEFSPKYKSDLASLYELYYWLAYKAANQEITLEDFKKYSSHRIVLRGM